MHRRSFLGAAAAASSLAARPAGAAANPAKPNIILIYCDDLGYGDLGCYGSKLRTPNLDRMAAEGARFTHFYSANPVCSPSRAALMTGRYPTRVGVQRVFFPQDKVGLAADERTMANVLKEAGYRTMCVGKWHLGHLPEFLPTSRGFDHYFGIPYSNDMTPAVVMRDREVAEKAANMGTITAQYTSEAVKFIEGGKDQPFFLYFPHTMPHIPLGAGEQFRGKSPHGLYGDVIEEIDWSVGEILSALKKQGLDRNTLVMFSSDNGPWYQGSPGKLRGRKGVTYEGGVRVPFLARFPGRIPKGMVSDAIGSTMDLLPTLAGLTGAKLPEKPLDGKDIWPLLSGKQKSHDREVLLYFDNWELQCARLGRWKLHVARYSSFIYGPAPVGGRQNLALRPPELYNLVEDPDESFDVSGKHPEIVKDIQARIEKLLPGFPAEVRNAWAETQKRETMPAEPGRLPRMRPAG
ncbi:MAG: sulfatase [Bryobacteraceae bacterium]|nr:sulfatase [Bryobacteraceae bacterium]